MPGPQEECYSAGKSATLPAGLQCDRIREFFKGWNSLSTKLESGMVHMRSGMVLWCAFLSVTWSLQARAGDDLTGKIEAVTGSDYKQAHWGILVVDAQTGETIYAQNPDHL